MPGAVVTPGSGRATSEGSPIQFLLDVFAEAADRPAFIGEGEAYTYRWLLDRIAFWDARLREKGIHPGQVVAIQGDYSPEICAVFLTLTHLRTVVVPFASVTLLERNEFAALCGVSLELEFSDNALVGERTFASAKPHDLISKVTGTSAPGLVVFSSGSTGQPKGILHDLGKLLEKFRTPRPALRTLAFLQLDHLGGINTLFHILSNGGTVISVAERSPRAVCRAIEANRIEVLPVTPTFLNLIIMSGEHKKWDLSSLKVISYGTEVMPETTLAQVRKLFPGVRLQQTYGLSELGVLRTRSRDDGSLWVKVGGEGFETQVRDGILWIRAHSAMIGYLNAPQPFDAEGWFNTEDQVEVDGEYLRILGRVTDIINVGGQKVFPSEVESVLLEMDNIKDAVVSGEKNFITGNVVTALVMLHVDESGDSVRQRVREYCKGRLSPYKIPMKVAIATAGVHNARFKRSRSKPANTTIPS